jgi:cyclic-di-AMP phosphodiesterase PgpH
MANFFKYGLKKNKKKSSPQEEKSSWYKTDLTFYSTLFGVFVLVTLFLFPRAGGFKYSDLKEGSVSTDQVLSPITFLVEKDKDELEEELRKAEESVYAVFIHSDSVENAALVSLTDLYDKLVPILISITSDSVKLVRIESLLNNKNIIISKEGIPFFNQLTKSLTSQGVVFQDKNKLKEYFEQLQRILVDIFSYGILDIEKQNIPGNTELITISNGQENQKRIENVFELNGEQSATNRLLERLKNEFGESNDTLNVGYAILEKLISPNLLYNFEETSERIDEAIANVPLIQERILKDQKIIDDHEQVEAKHIQILRQLDIAIAKQENQASIFSLILSWFGKLLLVILTLAPLVIFLFFQRSRIWSDRKMMFIIFSSMLFVVIVSSFVLHYGVAKYLIPIAVVPIIVTSYLDTRTGFFAGLTLSLIISAQSSLDFELTLIGLLSTTAAIFALGFSKYRKKLANSTIFIFVAYFISIAVFGIIRYEAFSSVAEFWGFGIISSILSPMIAYSFIILFDAVFDVASEFKLIELSDLNNPLLKMFSIRSPGSYHHSLQVSHISEAAAESIGANALLTKVGAYYHDLGKMFMPEYFVENQKGGKNPHDRLTPRLSSLILVNHVRKGYEFAKENKIPTIVCKFITEHHGSSLMQFFYEKAKEKTGDDEILETDFRYPGKKPQSKETGILMLADSVEATVRSVKEPTLGKIRNVIRNSVDNKIRSGELDDCPLTMKDLAEIVETFSNVLIGIHHGRLEYPGQKNLFKRSSFDLKK